MHNKVVYHAMKVLNAPEWGFRLPALRFNFRGTGLSEGHYDGQAESADVIAALDWLSTEYKLPVVVCGFSFGAAMSLAACCQTDRSQSTNNIHAIAALGLPTQGFNRRYYYPFLAGCRNVPKLFLSGDQDQFAPSADLEQAVATASDPKRLVFIPNTDHFFSGQLDGMQQSLAAWLKEQLQ